MGTHIGQQVSVFCIAFSEDVAGAIQGGFCIVNAGFGVEILRCKFVWITLQIRKDGVRQRLKTRFPGDLRTGAALGLEGRI